MTFQRFRFVSILGILAIGAVAIAGGVRYTQAKTAAVTSAPDTSKKQLYRCPMHPQVVQDHPGRCPICGMNLVPVEPGATAKQPSCPAPGHSGGCCGGPAGGSDASPEPSK